MERIRHYFPDLSKEQLHQFAQLEEHYRYWNAQINVIARTDIDNLYERHVLHALAIAKVCPWVPGTRVVDVGTGGGFPGIPLAILYPAVDFHLVDSIGKKVRVVSAVQKALGLENVLAEQRRAETLTGTYDFLVSRAVTKADVQLRWAQRILAKEQRNKLPNGLLLLKGGDLREELRSVQKACYTFPISDYFSSPFFATKSVVYIGG